MVLNTGTRLPLGVLTITTGSMSHQSLLPANAAGAVTVVATAARTLATANRRFMLSLFLEQPSVSARRVDRLRRTCGDSVEARNLIERIAFTRPRSAAGSPARL